MKCETACKSDTPDNFVQMLPKRYWGADWGCWLWQRLRRSGVRFVEGKSIKQICRDLRLSRNTVRKVIHSGDTEFSCDRSVQPRQKIDPWRDQLDGLLTANAVKPKRARLTLVRIYEELRNIGYDGSYDAVRRYAANWSREPQEMVFDAHDKAFAFFGGALCARHLR